MTAKGLTEADLRVVQIEAIYLPLMERQARLNHHRTGIYLCLFLAALPIFIQSKTLKNTSAFVFFLGNILIFTLISTHSGLGLFHVVVAFAYETSVEGTMRAYNQNYYIPILFATFIFMIGDALMIYRCFLIWQRSYWAIFPSVVIAATSSGLHITVVWFATQVPRNLFLVRRWPPIALTVIFYFIQTSLTTSLIVWKIRSQSRWRTGIGLVSVHVPSILSITRIIAESAMVYTVGMFVFVIFLFVDNPGRLVIHSCMLPITGIVFVLMALRIDAVRQESRHIPASASLVPTWLVEEHKSTSPGTARAAEGDERVARDQTPPLIPSFHSPQPTSQKSTSVGCQVLSVPDEKEGMNGAHSQRMDHLLSSLYSPSLNNLTSSTGQPLIPPPGRANTKNQGCDKAKEESFWKASCLNHHRDLTISRNGSHCADSIGDLWVFDTLDETLAWSSQPIKLRRRARYISIWLTSKLGLKTAILGSTNGAEINICNLLERDLGPLLAGGWYKPPRRPGSRRRVSSSKLSTSLVSGGSPAAATVAKLINTPSSNPAPNGRLYMPLPAAYPVLIPSIAIKYAAASIFVMENVLMFLLTLVHRAQ
ncbi:hypothetical protein BKA70DRAFT_1240460 [Coprinopsis sp. MPI-PUGE-AT-0042]|nr:hypothetical protein BKA70DRAFT_1240460 [Coprinopsis sp. MPI-PUGE-AT-0042]